MEDHFICFQQFLTVWSNSGIRRFHQTETTTGYVTKLAREVDVKWKVYHAKQFPVAQQWFEHRYIDIEQKIYNSFSLFGFLVSYFGLWGTRCCFLLIFYLFFAVGVQNNTSGVVVCRIFYWTEMLIYKCSSHLLLISVFFLLYLVFCFF